MSDSDPFVQKHAPSPSREVRKVGGYEAAFYPGFVRKLTAHADGSATVVYEQEKGVPFYLPAGENKPWHFSEISFSDLARNRRFRLYVDDPHQEIERIEVVFKGRGSAEGCDENGGDREKVVIEDAAILCPPFCPE